MILGSWQAERFIRLFNMLMEYVATRVLGRSEFSPEQMGTDNSLGEGALSAVWGGADGDDGATVGDRGVIDDFVREFGRWLSPSDAEEVLSWKNGVYTYFPIARIGDDVVFIYGSCAFCVRGITREIDRDAQLPELAKGVILPFDGLITYGTMLSKHSSIVLTETTKEQFTEDAREFMEAGRVARTADEFARLAVEARERIERPRVEQADWRSAMDANADEVVEGQYRSPLADLDWDARMRAFEACLRERERASVMEVLLEASMRGTPKDTSLVGCLASMTKVELQGIAEIEKVSGNFNRMRKAELAEEVAAAIDIDLKGTVEDVAQRSSWAIRALVDTVRAGG